jgi:hypothetical protein
MSPTGYEPRPPLDILEMSTYDVVRHIYKSAAAVTLTFLVTLTVFPALIAEIRPASNLRGAASPPAGRIFGDLWLPFLFLTFNVGDTAGRILSKHCVAWPKLIGILALVRFGFIPVLLVMSAPPTLQQPLGPWARCCDILSVMVVSLLAMSNGSLVGSAMIHGPTLVPKDFRSQAGTVMAFFLQTGLLLGSVSSFVLRGLRCDCNPFVQ